MREVWGKARTGRRLISPALFFIGGVNMIKKITKREFISKLEGTDFISSMWNIKDNVVFENIHKLAGAKPIYHVAKIKQRSNFIECYKSENDCSRRDFDHKNSFYITGNFLLHKNYGDDWNCWMINRTGGVA